MENKFEKTIWTLADFPEMSWHDCAIYAIQMSDTVDLDIDYILKWVLEEGTTSYKFWVAPATLSFQDARNLRINIKLDFVNGLEISNIEQKVLNQTEFEYLIETQEGTIELIASGFTQICRKPPVLKTQQCLPEEERGGYPDRILPVNDAAADELKKRTLTNLYNARPTWLANAHAALDAAVAAAYGWPADIDDADLLGRLLALNRERAGAIS